MDIDFIDSDEEIIKAAGHSIPDIFNIYGEPKFRELEERVITRILRQERKVLATGGGAYMNPRIRNAIDLKVSMAYSRPKKITLEFEDGSETLTIKPFMTLQKLTFPKHNSQEVTITMSDIMPGKQFEDSCISELYLK